LEGENFQIGLENHDTETRKKANNDFVSFWAQQAKMKQNHYLLFF